LVLKIAADENFNNHILRALQRQAPLLEYYTVRLQDTGVAEQDDPTVLAWAAQENRLLLTHDVETIPDFAFERVRNGLAMSGVLEVNDRAPIANIVEDILLVVQAGKENEWEGQVLYIPFPKKSGPESLRGRGRK
jgi:hypothetical protein